MSLGIDAIKRTFGNVGTIVASVCHDYAYFNYFQFGDTVVVEGTCSGRAADGSSWRAWLC
jgi:hypothetical protein